MPQTLPLALFAATYFFLALGRIRGLALDRTGFALLGALAFLAVGAISLEQAKAAVDAPTLTVLFAMMLLSAQYQLSGLYGAICRRLARTTRPRRATPCGPRNKKFFARGVFYLWDCCTNVVVRRVPVLHASPLFPAPLVLCGLAPEVPGNFIRNLEILTGGRSTFPQGQDRIVPVSFDLVPRRAPGG